VITDFIIKRDKRKKTDIHKVQAIRPINN
jgi:hypothetical protein